MTDVQYSQFLQDTALVWDWPIGIYLFLLGISVGMVTISILLKRTQLKATTVENNNVIKMTAILAPLTVCCGLLILVFHLTMPWTFWKLMIFYNPLSVMSIGVMLFQIYMFLLIIWLAIIFQPLIERVLDGKFSKIIFFIKKIAGINEFIELSLLVIAIVLGAYTGFLLSALKTYPMLNNPVLPILFLFSGVSSGAAAIILSTTLLTKEPTDSPSLNFVHKVETPVVWFELFLLAAFFIGLYFGGGQKTLAATNALIDGGWANIFWFGVLLTGIILPLLFNFIVPSGIKHSKGYLFVVCCMSLTGTLLLRLFILYAGQMTLA